MQCSSTDVTRDTVPERAFIGGTTAIPRTRHRKPTMTATKKINLVSLLRFFTKNKHDKYPADSFTPDA